MKEGELWGLVEEFFVERFDTEKHPAIDTILFLIGVQELGSGQQKYTKDDKLNILHIAVCRLLQPLVTILFRIMMIKVIHILKWKKKCRNLSQMSSKF